MSYKLIVTIVPHNYGDEISSIAVKAGAGGGTVLMGRGTAENSILQLLGLGDTSKDITYNIVEQNIEQKVREAIIEETKKKKNHFGVMFSILLGDFMKAGAVEQDLEGETIMEETDSYEMINMIVNKGYAEDAMAAARKAGARGGTIIAARGTAKEGDAKFFGMEIVPEKEMLMILVPCNQKEEIIASIKQLKCFEKAGSGIIFCNKASDFTTLGKE
ncbi:MAG: transcriptional regulator [Treponema sp.]|nr:transcriptional regulator [Treponema sp.]